MPRQDRRTSPFALSTRPAPARRVRAGHHAEDSQAVAQDYLQYLRWDYERRRGHGHRHWRDLSPAYAFALTTHAAHWPRGGGDHTDAELAEHWEQMRGASRLDWAHARAVVEDAWLALDHMPAPAVHGLLQ